MQKRIHPWLPEIGLAILALFFTYRELGIFPGAWLDEGLFIMTAKNLAAGKGYGIPLLNEIWYYPYFLAIGPTVIYPVALSLKLFGASIAAARLPMTLYILGTCIVTYVFTKNIAGKAAARWSTLLLITFSAFINTGKPVLGEVPAFFFLLLGLLCLEQVKHPLLRGVLSGIFFGLAIITKITLVLVLPALAIALVFECVRRRWKDVGVLLLSGATAFLLCVPWRYLELTHTPDGGGLSTEIMKFVFGGGDIPMLYVLRYNWQVLIRLPFIAFCIFFVLGISGVWSARPHIRTSTRVIVTATVILITLYFLNSYGWYRHLLPAHLLLLPFVQAGAMQLVGQKPAVRGMIAIAIIQGLWQVTHFGSGFGTASAEGARIVREQYAEKNLLIEEAELMAQLPENPHWLYLVRDKVSPSMPERFRTVGPKERCWTHVRKLNEEEEKQYKDRAIKAGSYYILPPAKGCK